MKCFIISIFAFFTSVYSIAQCPNSVLVGSSRKCVKFIWTTPPSTLPNNFVYFGSQYIYVAGNGTTVNPAEYIESTSNATCNNYNNLIGTIYLPNGEECSYGGTTLPIQWLGFNVSTTINGQTIITWKVQESNIKEYILETSNDGISFYALSNFASKSDGLNTYTYLQNNNFNSTIYYRVKQISKDGTIGYSTIIKQFNAKKSNSITVYPNPANKAITVNTSMNNAINNIAQIFDMQGKSLITYHIKNSTEVIDISNLKEGLYTIKINDGASTLFKKL